MSLFELVDALKELDVQAKMITIHKTNCDRDAVQITLPGNGNVFPLVYQDTLDRMLSDHDVSDPLSAAALVMEILKDQPCGTPDISMLTDREYVLSHISLRACKTGWNSSLLEDTVFETIPGTDLAVYPMLNIDRDRCIRVTSALLRITGMSAEEAISAGKANSSWKAIPMAEMLKKMMGGMPEMNDLEVPDMPMTVISNNDTFYGASAICDSKTLDTACDMLGSEMIRVIPSSVHELIAVPACIIGKNQMNDMICDINGSYVAEDEQLSDISYIWQKGCGFRSAETGDKVFA